MTGFPCQPKAQMLQVPQPAVDQLGAAAAGPGGKVSGFQQCHLHAPQRGVAKYARPGDSAANYEEIIGLADKSFDQDGSRGFVELLQAHQSSALDCAATGDTTLPRRSLGRKIKTWLIPSRPDSQTACRPSNPQ